MWLFVNCHRRDKPVPKQSLLLLLIIVLNCFHPAHPMFFPFSNFFARFRNPQNVHFGEGNTASRGGVGNSTSFRIPMLPQHAQRRVDVVTTVVSNAIDHDHPQVLQIQSNFTDGKADSVATKLLVPTSTSVTTSISTSQQQTLGSSKTPSTLTLPFTPNLFGMMSYVQALKDIKRNFKDHEKDRKMSFHSKDSGDLMTRILRTLIQKVVNKYQKRTELIKLQILKRQDRLQHFLQLPMVSQVVASDQQNLQKIISAGNGAPSAIRPAAPSILDSFLI